MPRVFFFNAILALASLTLVLGLVLLLLSPSFRPAGPEGSIGTIPVGETLAPVPSISYVVELRGGAEVKIDDPWAPPANLLVLQGYHFSCQLPGKSSWGIAANSSHRWFYCVFKPNTGSGNMHAMIGQDNEPVTTISWSGLDTERNYRYTLIWPQLVTLQASHPQLGGYKITAEPLPRYPVASNTEPSVCQPLTSITKLFDGNNQVIGGFDGSYQLQRVNSQDLKLIHAIAFTSTTRFTKLELIFSCPHLEHLAHRVEFNNQLTFNSGDVLVIEKVIRISS